MADVTDFVPFVAPYAPGAPTPTLFRAIVDTLMDFCERTKVWREDLSAIDVTDYRVASPPEDEGIYDLSGHIQAPYTSTARIVAVMVAQHDDRYIISTTEAWLDTHWPRLTPEYRFHLSYYATREQWRIVGDTKARAYFQPDPDSIRLVPLPETTATGALKVNVSLKPLPTVQLTNTVGDVVLNDHHEKVACGALARLLAMPNKPWSAPKVAVEKSMRYEAGVDEARGKQVRSNERDDRTTGRVRSYY